MAVNINSRVFRDWNHVFW